MRPGMTNLPAAASTLSEALASSSHVTRYGSRSVPLPRTVKRSSRRTVRSSSRSMRAAAPTVSVGADVVGAASEPPR